MSPSTRPYGKGLRHDDHFRTLYYAIEHELDLEMHVVPTTSGYEIVLWKVGDHTPASVKRVLTVRWRMHAPESSAWECAIAIKKEISPGGYFT